MRDSKHLKFIRTLPCCKCRANQPSEAAHIRIGTDGGTGKKPSDKYTVPLCHNCHHEQHQIGERSFWGDVDKAKALAESLYHSKCWKKSIELILNFRRENAKY